MGDTIHMSFPGQCGRIPRIVQMVVLTLVYSDGKKNIPKRGNATALGWGREACFHLR